MILILLQELAKRQASVSAQTNANVVTDTTLAKWETFKDTLVGIGNQIGDKFLPSLKKLTMGMLDLVSLNTDKFVKMFDGISESFSNFVDFLLQNQVSIVKGIQNLINWLSDVVSNIPAFINYFLWAKDAVLAFGKAVSDFLSPIIGIVKNLFSELMKNVGSFNFRALFDSILSSGLFSNSTLTQIEHLGYRILEVFKNGFNIAWEKLVKPAFQMFSNWVTSPDTIQSIKNSILTSWDFFTEWASKIWSYINPKLTEAYNYLLSWVTDSSKRSQLVSGLNSAWSFFVDWSSEQWTKIQPKLIEIWNNLISWVTDSSKRQVLLNKLNDSWNSFTEWGSSIWKYALPKLSELFQSLVSWITDPSKRQELYKKIRF